VGDDADVAKFVGLAGHGRTGVRGSGLGVKDGRGSDRPSNVAPRLHS
jgi:hypothetical protein